MKFLILKSQMYTQIWYYHSGLTKFNAPLNKLNSKINEILSHMAVFQWLSQMKKSK
jgi:hypothetical protein